MKKRSFWGVLIYGIIIVLGLMWLWNIFGFGSQELTHSKVEELFRAEQVKEFAVADGTIYLTLHEPYEGNVEVTGSMSDVESFRREMGELIRNQHELGIIESYDWGKTETVTPMDYIWPLLIVGLVLLLIWFIMMSRINSRAGMNNFGRARTVMGCLRIRRSPLQM